LLDLRAQSLVAVGDLRRAGETAVAMQSLARRERSAAFETRALQCEAMVQMRAGNAEAALKVARRALTATRRSGQPRLEA